MLSSIKINNLRVDEQKTNFIVSLVFGFCGAFAIFFSTPWGPSMGSDSVVYLLSAKNLVDVGYFGIIWGQGSFEPLAVNPPVLPLVIAGLYSSGMDVLSAMRIVDIVSFGLLLFFVGFLSYQITRKLSLSIQLSILFFCTPFIFALYTAAMSESLFYFFMVTGLLLLLLYLETESKSTLVFSAILAVGAFMTRYVGIVIPLACLLGIVFLGHQNQKARIYDAFIFGLISFLVPLIWFFWNYLATSSLGGRIMTGEVGLWKPSIEFRLGLSSVIWNWMVLNSNVAVSYSFRKVSISLFLFGIGILCAVLFFKVFQSPKNKPYLVLVRWIILFALTAGLYVVVYFFAFALTMPTPDLFERTASPIYIAVIMVIFGMIYLAIEIWQGKKWLKWFPWALLVVMLTSYLPKTITQANTMRIDGGGYTSNAWRESRIIHAIRQLSDDIPIVTNEPAAVLFLTGRESIWVTEAMKIKSDNPEGAYGTSLTDLGETVFRKGGALVLFPSFYWQLDSIYYEQTQNRLNAMLQDSVLYKDFGSDSGIYFYSEKFIPDEAQ